MNDCPNGDVRDLLPDLLHDRLAPSVRAMVEAHVRDCADCQAELALLRDLRSTLRRTPSLDLTAISAGVPAYRSPARRSWVGWRTAAAITFIAAGGSSLVVWQRDLSPQSDSASGAFVAAAPADDSLMASAPVAPSVAANTPHSPPPRVSVPVTASVAAPVLPAPAVQQPVQAEARELAMAGGSLTDLSDRELASFLREIEAFDAVPTTDVDATALAPIAPRRGQP